jgi:hypothetical protein
MSKSELGAKAPLMILATLPDNCNSSASTLAADILASLPACNFCNKHCPWLKIKLLKPLHQLVKLHHCNAALPGAWMPALHLVFHVAKLGIASGPCLACCGHTKLASLVTDWSADRFGAALTQLNDSPASVTAIEPLIEDGARDFNLTLKGACLCPFHFELM